MEFEKSKIQKLIFDVQYFEQESAGSMQNKIISDFNNYLVKILDKNLDKYTQQRIIKAAKVELDLGVLTKADLENNLSQIFEKKLESYLKSLKIKIENRNLPSGFEETSLDDYIYNFLYLYFKNGVIPWNLLELGEANRLEYWLSFLYNLNVELSQSLGVLFVEENARKRLITLIKQSKQQHLMLSKLFLPEVISDKANVERIILIVVESITKNYPSIALIIQTQFFIWLASKQQLSNTKELNELQLANNFYTFLEQSFPSVALQLLALIIENGKEKVASDFEEQFFHSLNEIYFGNIVDRYAIKYLRKEVIDISPLRESYFNDFLRINFQHQQELIIDVTQKIITQVIQIFPTEKKEKIEGVVRSLILDSLKTVSLPDDLGQWFKNLLDEISLVFGVGTHQTVKEYLIQEQDKLADKFKLDKTIDQIELPSLTITIEQDEFNIKLQQAVIYFELFQSYGARALESIFHEPIKVLTQLIIWLKEEHPGTYKKIIKSMQGEISPLWRRFIVDDTPKEFSQHFEYSKQITESVGEDLILEILVKGYLPSHETHRIGLGKIKSGISSFIEKNPEKIKNLIAAHSEKLDSAISYLRMLLSPESFKKVEKLFSVAEIDKGVELSDEIVELSKFQLLIPIALEHKLSNEQKNILINYIKKQVDTRNTEFAIYLISLKKDELQIISDLLPASYSNKINQLIKTFKQKYKPDRESEDQIEPELEKQEEFRKFAEGEVIYLRNAGIVLLNPYLTMLFNRLELTENKKFKDDNAKIKAMQLVQYIGTSDEKPEEHDLVLNKVLVGLDPYEPLGDLQILTTEEKEMCDGLIDAIIKNWSVLKNTTRNNLRASFFIRNGKLLFEENNWRLSVEQKSIDVLLDKLPWSYSMIKLPWMEYPLMVEWR